jgi:hypothetical protein
MDTRYINISPKPNVAVYFYCGQIHYMLNQLSEDTAERNIHVVTSSHFDNVYITMTKRTAPQIQTTQLFLSARMLVPVEPTVAFSLVVHGISHLCSIYQLLAVRNVLVFNV